MPVVANKEVTSNFFKALLYKLDIEEAGVVNLEIRNDYKEGDELISTDSEKETE